MTNALSVLLSLRAFRRVLATLLALTLVAACGKTAAPGAEKTRLLNPEDVYTVAPSTSTAGPLITGSLQAERSADLHAEVAAVVLQVLKDNGEAVRRGDLLVRLDATSIRDQMISAETAEAAANHAFAQHERQFERLRRLQERGAISMPALEEAELSRNQAHSDLVAARARTALARQQLTYTEVRAPFDGVVSERQVSIGDTAQVGKALLKVIDPASLRFEGLVPTAHLRELAQGQPVQVQIHGYSEQTFAGVVRYVGASADTSTRQTKVLVGFVGAVLPHVAGLYAEGRVQPAAQVPLALPEAAVVQGNDRAYVWRVEQGVLRKVPVDLGKRDARRGEIALRGGLAVGDYILRYPDRTWRDGQKLEFLTSPTAVIH
jgi:membrane fusion protein, multidrug efflux system